MLEAISDLHVGDWDTPKRELGLERWWLERYSLDEIREMAGAFWPEDGAGVVGYH